MSPPRTRRVTSLVIEAAVARASQSRPHRVQSVGSRPWRRGTISADALKTPNGGR